MKVVGCWVWGVRVTMMRSAARTAAVLLYPDFFSTDGSCGKYLYLLQELTNGACKFGVSWIKKCQVIRDHHYTFGVTMMRSASAARTATLRSALIGNLPGCEFTPMQGQVAQSLCRARAGCKATRSRCIAHAASDRSEG